jgi:hypothetical protein
MSDSSGSNQKEGEVNQQDQVSSTSNSLRNLQNQGPLSNNYASRPNTNSYSSYTPSPYSQSGYSMYNNPSRYGSYGNNSGYSSYGYNSGYNSYGNSSPYSNNYSKPLPQQGQGNEQAPQPNVRNDVWGFLNGFHAMLNVLYAGTGIVHFGKMFFKMTFKVIKMICGKSLALIFKLTGFNFLKRMMRSFTKEEDWLTEFSFGEKTFENAWGNNEGSTTTLFGKALLVLRICSLLGSLAALFMRSKAKNSQHPPVQIELVDAEMPSSNLEQKIVQFEEIKNLYEEVKLIEEGHDSIIIDSSTSLSKALKEENEEFEAINKSLDNFVKETDSQVLTKDSKVNSSSALNTSPLIPSEKHDTPSIEAVTIVDETPKKDEIKISTISTIASLTFQEEDKLKHNEMDLNKDSNSEQNSLMKEELSNQNPRDQIVSEDFWKNEEILKNIEKIQNEVKLPQENSKKTPFELPSVLETLRSKPASSSKPWLMKKKKPVENQEAESTPQPLNNETNTTEKTPEPNKDLPEVEAEARIPERLEECNA